jgi:2-oxoisovalerate dehydrogenase E1 component beta subunit
MSTTYLEAIREGLWEEMERDPNVFCIGEDIGEYGGAFKVTAGFLERFGATRVVDTPISEAAIVGASIGAGLMGLRPVAEMQFADFITCGFDQIVNFAAKCRYRWNAGVPIVIRSPSGGGIHGGPFHSQNPEMWFVRTPGLKVVCPATAYDAKGLIKSAIRDNDPVLFFEHKGLYRKIKEDLPSEEYTVPIGKAKVVREGRDLSIITYGAMVWTALEAAEKLAQEGCSIEVVDLRTLMPLDRETVCASVRKTSKVLLLHEDTRTGGMAGELAVTITENVFEYLDGPIVRVTAPDTPVPYSPPLEEAQCGKGRRESSLAVSLLNWRWPPRVLLPPTTGQARAHPDRRGRWYWKTLAAIVPYSPRPNSASPKRWPISSPRDCWLRSICSVPAFSSTGAASAPAPNGPRIL